MAHHMKDSTDISYVSRETCEYVLALYEKYQASYTLLVGKWLHWNRTVNLFSRKTDESLLKNHILHSLFLVASTGVSYSNEANTIIDAGTGGGLPGLPMAIACPERDFLLVDKVRKKTLVVKDIIRSLGLTNASVIHQNIADIATDTPCRVVSKHAFPVDVLLKALQNKNISEISLLKGDDVFSEINGDLTKNYRITLQRFNLTDQPFFHNKYIVHLNKR